ncbi:hypothetical protein BH11ACT8_BH11ACT8_21390 [soil metagenome]
MTPRISVRLSGALCAVLLVTAGLLAGCGGGDPVAVGGVEAVVGGDAADGAPVSVLVPLGTLDLVVGAPVDRIGDLQAPDGGSLLRISTSFHDAQVRHDVWRFAARAETMQPVDLQVDVGSTSYPVGTVRRASAGADVLPRDLVVGLAESPSEAADLTIGVAYDGLVQHVALDGTRTPGPADPLYVDPDLAPSPTACADVALDHGVRGSAASCRIERADLLPYLPELGWAESGRTWVALSLVVALDPVELGTGPQRTRYVLDSVADHSTLAGQPAAGRYDDSTAGGGWHATLAFDAPLDDAGTVAGSADLVLDVGLAPLDANLHVGNGAPESLQLTATVPTHLATAP